MNTYQAKQYVNDQMEGIDIKTFRVDLLEKRINEVLKDLRINNNFVVFDDINKPRQEIMMGTSAIDQCSIEIDDKDKLRYLKFTYL